MGITLNEVVPWGRSLQEYREMFALEERDRSLYILGCGDGPASFNAEGTKVGWNIQSCDPIYAFSADEIRSRVATACDQVLTQLSAKQDDFLWERFRSPEEVVKERLAAMDRFFSDFEAGKKEGRYVAAGLPVLPFASDAFHLALVSHLLFLYSERLGASFHQQSVRELLRVAGQVRIFPLATLAGSCSTLLESSIAAVQDIADAEIVPVAYRFQKTLDGSGESMLRLTRRGGTPPGSPTPDGEWDGSSRPSLPKERDPAANVAGA